MEKLKVIIMFMAGILASVTIGQTVLKYSESFPLVWFGITITKTLNSVLIIVPGLISLIIIYLFWFRKSKVKIE
ncbi:hypothetical protein [Lutibacter sp. B1]|uniref:hypothetical protein n=1 Tax=Lutibacter sp. B1 TaxID=2725996 RepID=UPI0014564292|nr:hypothetical protein [Lutibacter sp. B1]NLP59017.1 hypothetical protein [Lutibacter sp. B1]